MPLEDLLQEGEYHRLQAWVPSFSKYFQRGQIRHMKE